MNLAEDVDLEEFVHAKDELSGADIKAVCTEAGLLALRERRMRVTMADLRAAREKTMFAKKDTGPEGLCESPLSRNFELETDLTIDGQTCKTVKCDSLSS